MKTKNTVAKGAFWGALLFYLLIAFEFFYMAGPFAAYFYSAYAPALRFFHAIPILAWLDSFFLPHAVRETSSALINAHEVTGAILAIGGFLAFCIGACQVYYSKIKKKGVVTGGIYNYVRHPQYISLMVCSFGLLLLWPRYLAAIMFVTMIFAYYLLAKVEERECSAEFGQAYLAYQNRTNMFLPFAVKSLKKIHAPKTTGKKAAALLAAYVTALLVVLGLAKGLQTLSISSLYVVYTKNSIDISVCALSDEEISGMMDIVRSDDEVAVILSGFDDDTRYLNYILPAEWYAAEIPMNGVELGQGHRSPSAYDRNLFKVIITRVVVKGNQTVALQDLLTGPSEREPIAEIWIDLSEQVVTQILGMLKSIKYEDIPVAIF